MSEIAKRMVLLINTLGMSSSSFAKCIGIDPSNMAKMMKGEQKVSAKTLQRITLALPMLNIDWLKTGDGDMAHNGERLDIARNVQHNSPNAVMFANAGNATYTRACGHINEQCQADSLCPIVPARLCKKENTDVYEEVVVKRSERAEEICRFPEFSPFDLYYRIPDESMSPEYKIGDIVALKDIQRSGIVVNGNVYVMDTYSMGLVFRVLIDRGESFECRALGDSDRYENFFIPKDDVIRVFRLKGLFRYCN